MECMKRKRKLVRGVAGGEWRAVGGVNAKSLAATITIFLLTCTTLNEAHSPRVPLVVKCTTLRGGQDENTNNHDADENAGSEETASTKQKRLWPIGSLFEIGNNVKADSSLMTEEEVMASYRPESNGRGGALVKQQAKPQRFRWLAPLDLSQTSPFSSRLVSDTTEDTTDGKKSSSSAAAMLEKSWWVNMWSEQIAIDANATQVSDQTALADEVNETEDAEETTKEQAMTNTNEETEASQTVTNDAKEEDSDEIADRVMLPQPVHTNADGTVELIHQESSYISSGAWSNIDKMLTFGYASSHPSWRISRQLRSVRKATARVTGLHGLLSGKHPGTEVSDASANPSYIRQIRRRIAAIDRARVNLEIANADIQQSRAKKRGFWGREEPVLDYAFVLEKTEEEKSEERLRKARVKEIDRMIIDGQRRLQQLACEKDVLQKRHNPLWNYTVEVNQPAIQTTAGVETDDLPVDAGTEGMINATRRFNFPPKDLVDEYLDMLFSSRRLVKLNHTDLWRNGGMQDDDDDEDDFLSMRKDEDSNIRRRRNNNENSGNWFLRNGLGEKIGEAAETAAYKAVCAAIMSVLARSLSALHGINIMTHSDIRLFMEQSPDLPLLAAGIIPGSGMHANYAQETIRNVVHRGARKHKKKRKNRYSDGSFLQRDALVETLISLCQISAPLLKLFPIAWQRALLGNIITLITSVMTDFCAGLEFQILGHRLSFAFEPITEEDMIRGMVGDGQRRRHNPARFEAAVRATAEDLSQELKFLDRWHERALGSGVLREQIANLIARLVLTLVEDLLNGARMDLWTAHAGGPRLVAGIEYRTAPSSSE